MVTIVSSPAAPRVDRTLEAPLGFGDTVGDVLLAACDAEVAPFAAAALGGLADPDALVAFMPPGAAVLFADALAAACGQSQDMGSVIGSVVITRTRNVSKLF
jgi:hypothetical protein